MKRIVIAIVILISCGPGLIAQSKESTNKSFELHTMPLTLADYTPRLRLGAEYNASDKIGYCVELGIGNYFLNSNQLVARGSSNDYLFYEIRTEVKYYFNTNKSNHSLYYSVELFYINMTDVFENNSYYPENTSGSIFYTKATFYKQKYGLHVKGGIKLIAFKRIDFDIYAGIGVARRNIDYKNVINPNTDYPEDDWGIGIGHKFEGKYTIFHATMGCKIGVILWKN
jgi:hypothetical protein